MRREQELEQEQAPMTAQEREQEQAHPAQEQAHTAQEQKQEPTCQTLTSQISTELSSR